MGQQVGFGKRVLGVEKLVSMMAVCTLLPRTVVVLTGSLP